ncbi:MAG: hypothetical protein V1894_00020 [Chloroflexota bacterium]
MEPNIKWNDLIELIMDKNNGMASLNFLYEQASSYKQLPSGDWQKTLRGVLYREVNRGRFKKIGLGVYALPKYEDKSSAYSYASKNLPLSQYLSDVKDYHTTFEGMLLELGTFFEYMTYTGDLNRSFDGKKLRELCGLTEVPDFTYPELKTLVSKCDTIWFTKARLPFPKYIFEVESTTDFTNSMLKMYQLVNFDARFILVASQERKGIFTNRIEKEPFAKEKHRFSFRSFEDVGTLYFNSVEHHELKTKFLS